MTNKLEHETTVEASVRRKAAKKYIADEQRLTFVRLVSRDTLRRPGKRDRALYLCSCGKEVVAYVNNVSRGHTRSCGCLSDEARVLLNTIHGMSYTAEYSVWQSMVKRCHQPNSKTYRDYGAKGIRVCDAWRKFEGFYIDMGNRPSPGHSLDRIDNTMGYQPGNVRWSTRSEQMRNRSDNTWIEFRGKRMTLAEFCELAPGIKRATVANRVRKGWDLERAISEPAIIGKNQTWQT